MINSTQAAWEPSKDILQNSRLGSWMRKLGFSNYDSFYQESIKKIDWFWQEAVQELDISWFSSPHTTLDLSRGVQYPEWFVGGKINVAYNAVEKWADNPSTRHRTALIWEGDGQEKKVYTFEQLNTAANAAANGFKQLGVKRGDVIFLYMPMIPETVIAMLAISKIGAVFTPAFSGYKADAVSARLEASEAKFLITADGYYRRGKIVNMKQEADKAAGQSHSLEKVIVVERIGGIGSWSSRDVAWKTITKNSSDFKAVETDSSEPFMIIYTSGTTGKPKGTVHTHAGFPIKAAFDAGICMDVRPDDKLFWLTDMGWMMGPFLVYGGLLNRAAIVLFEGTPDYPGPDRLWQLTDELQLTHLGISPTLIRSLMQHGTKPMETYVLSSLRLFASTGEPWNEKPWHWLFEKVGNSKIPIFNYSGGTETSGGIFGNVLVKPIQPANFNAALPGMAANVFNQEGQPITGEVGELVIQQPWVGMTKGFYKDTDHRYENTYWHRWKDTWVHGDWVIKDSDGYFTITGRSDDTLNIAGKRIGPTEIESCLVSHPAVAEAGVIGLPDELKGEIAAAFAVLDSSYESTEQKKEEILTYMRSRLGKALAPNQLYFLSDLPKTRNAKVMRRALKTVFLGESQGDLSALVNPEILEEITALREK
ncbi:AMP-binding protein [Sediminibacillus halophilus]|uniref:acetate--CoA ligase n=1 Tax=Sediminibacillus halophilus TaxID=482461 RepID=A0A1G9M888_9BACI|nr:acetyl-CoA synthetase [Sediminibacillus halophilus]